MPPTLQTVAEINDVHDVQANCDGITYAKGASVLKQLEAWVGRDAFFEGVRRYFRQHAHGNTTLDDLLVELEATSGRDLRAWSAVWLEQAGVTTLRPHLTLAEDGSITELAVLQEVPESHPVQRPHRLAIGCYDVEVLLADDGSEVTRLRRTRRVEVDVDGERTLVPELVGMTRPDLLLLNDDDLAYAKVRLDADSLATAMAHLGSFTDSLPRTLVWSAAWDMTRDGEMAARDFIDLVLDNITAETDSSVVRTLLGQLTTAARLYVAPGHRDDVALEVATELLGLARAAAPGSDAQLQLATAFAGRARTPEHLDVVAGLLSGEVPLPGLEVDTDLRWELLLSLVAGGRAAHAEISAEVARDDTATGRRAAAAAGAAIPTAEAKQAAWDGVVEGDDLPNAVRASVIGGFGRVHDTALLEPFVEPYFAALERVWRTQTNELAQQVVTGLYPVLLSGQPLLERTDAWLASAPEDLPALRRLVAENRDGVARAIRAQERDLLR